MHTSGLENSTRLLVFTSASDCRASENFDISSENYMTIICVMQDKCLFSDILRHVHTFVIDCCEETFVDGG